ncbi:ADP-ribose glycohydrolase MACROD2 [Folsomia candida]|uniref:O-acetyl-ADP-ribose deacetylase MACROD2 n=1 Tax=Folsomia candida TaxID=158441 RepID=A0A226E4G0_FOLCA|nr:ADP-ribose glycohydrolase MACROD2 [Folsomia candida]OXA52160.1 O-acetyl-ADP-ribose deacetylase MACROD2 [Folsomia candida]
MEAPVGVNNSIPPPPPVESPQSPNTTTMTTTSAAVCVYSDPYQDDEVDPASCILYALLTSGSGGEGGGSGDKNNNNFLLNRQQSNGNNNGVSWKAKPSWGIYVKDQGDHLPKFNLPRNVFYVDDGLNHLVSLSLADTCISKFAVDAIVNSTTWDFCPDNGVSKVLNEEAGPSLRMACASLTPLDMGQVIITEGFNLPAKYIIHTNGPHGMEPGWETNLQLCYQKSLQLLIDKGLRTIVFPCISTGSKSADPSLAARISLNTVRHFLQGHRDKVDRVIFSLHNTHQIVLYRRFMQWFFPVDIG